MTRQLSKNVQLILLAGGSGTRMCSNIPKVLHLVAGKTMIERVIYNASQVTNDIILVYSDQILEHLKPYKNMCKLVLQENPMGTAHAVSVALPLIDNTKINAVIFGDNPLITPALINILINKLIETNSSLITLAFERSDPAQYGRIITDELGNFLKIVEFKFATNEEKKLTLCNSGIMAFAPEVLSKYLLECLSDNHHDSAEFYLPDMVEICKRYGEKVTYLLAPNPHEVMGVNTKAELEEANNIYNTLFS